MFGKSKGKAADNNRDLSSAQQVQPSAVASSPAAAPEAISSISSGLTIVGKITGNGALAIFGTSRATYKPRLSRYPMAHRWRATSKRRN